MCLAGSQTPESAPKDQPGPTTTGTCLTGKRLHRFRQTTCLLEVLARSNASRICARRKDKTARRAALPHSLIASSMNPNLAANPEESATHVKQASSRPCSATDVRGGGEQSTMHKRAQQARTCLGRVGAWPSPKRLPRDPRPRRRKTETNRWRREAEDGGNNRARVTRVSGTKPTSKRAREQQIVRGDIICIPTITSTTPLYNRRSRPTAAAMLLWRKAILCRT